MPRVCVIVSCFNDGFFTLEAVESVAEEEPVELVVVDDGSTEGHTLKALDELRDRGIRVIRRENGGPGAARMTGVENTAARYVYPLDSDDRLVPGALARMCDALETAPEAGFAYGDFEVFGEFRGLYSSPAKFSLWAQTYANFIPGLSLIRRDALVAVGGWELPHGYEDWDLWLKLGEAGWTGVKVPWVVFERRIEGSERRFQTQRPRHRAQVEALRKRHPASFQNRRALARREGIPLRHRLAYPVIFGIRNRNLLPYRAEQLLFHTYMQRRLRTAPNAD
jgi:glycosyltransferase involved in cell wall biosynthesis